MKSWALCQKEIFCLFLCCKRAHHYILSTLKAHLICFGWPASSWLLQMTWSYLGTHHQAQCWFGFPVIFSSTLYVNIPFLLPLIFISSNFLQIYTIGNIAVTHLILSFSHIVHVVSVYEFQKYHIMKIMTEAETKWLTLCKRTNDGITHRHIYASRGLSMLIYWSLSKMDISNILVGNIYARWFRYQEKFSHAWSQALWIWFKLISDVRCPDIKTTSESDNLKTRHIWTQL